MNIRHVPANGRVAVLGAGISGLSFSYFLHKLRPDIFIDVFERLGEVGGWIKTQRLMTPTGDIVMEKGPRTLRGVSHGTLLIVDMLKNMDLAKEIQVLDKSSVANKKYLLNNQRRLVQVPDSVSSAGLFFVAAGLMKASLFWGLLKEPFVKGVKNGDESVEAFFNRRFGNTLLTNRVLSAILHGIYAGDVSKLSVKSILPSVVAMEKENGSIIKSVMKSMIGKRESVPLPDELEVYEQKISPNAGLLNLSQSLKQYPMMKLASGLQKFPLELAKYLKSTGKVKINTGTSLLSVDKSGKISSDTGTYKYDHIHSTIPTYELSKVLKGSEDIVELLDLIQYVDIFLVNVYSPSGKLIPSGKNGFGFLVPKHHPASNPDRLLGVIYDSDVEKNVTSLFSPDTNTLKNEKYHKITLMMGGHFYTNSVPSPSINLDIVKKVLKEHCGIEDANFIIRDEAAMKDKLITMQENDIVISYNLHQKCIPQYNVGYGEIKEKMLKLLESERLTLGGMTFGIGVGVPDCVLDGLKTAIKIKEV